MSDTRRYKVGSYCPPGTIGAGSTETMEDILAESAAEAAEEWVSELCDPWQGPVEVSVVNELGHWLRFMVDADFEPTFHAAIVPKIDPFTGQPYDQSLEPPTPVIAPSLRHLWHGTGFVLGPDWESFWPAPLRRDTASLFDCTCYHHAVGHHDLDCPQLPPMHRVDCCRGYGDVHAPHCPIFGKGPAEWVVRGYEEPGYNPEHDEPPEVDEDMWQGRDEHDRPIHPRRMGIR